MTRQHGLRLPNRTACNLSGRTLMLGDIMFVAVGDRLHRIAVEPVAVDCRRCLVQIERHGFPFEWLAVPPHAASVAAVKRRRRRRRSVPDALPCP